VRECPAKERRADDDPGRRFRAAAGGRRWGALSSVLCSRRPRLSVTQTAEGPSSDDTGRDTTDTADRADRSTGSVVIEEFEIGTAGDTTASESGNSRNGGVGRRRTPGSPDRGGGRAVGGAGVRVQARPEARGRRTGAGGGGGAERVPSAGWRSVYAALGAAEGAERP
jgi:hypothetical protein